MAQPEIKIIANKQFWLNARDFLHGAFMAVGGAVTTVLYTSFQAEHFVLDWKAIGRIAGGALFLYLGKNFFAPSNATIQVKTDDPKALSQQLKAADNINIDTTSEKPKIETSVG